LQGKGRILSSRQGKTLLASERDIAELARGKGYKGPGKGIIYYKIKKMLCLYPGKRGEGPRTNVCPAGGEVGHRTQMRPQSKWESSSF